MNRFISEEEVEAIRAKKQEEWEKKRKADDPIERPEEPQDNRSLAERLKENADRKQAEHDEKFALKNMIYTGMDDDEFEHVENLAKAEYERSVERYKFEGEAIKEFRKKVVSALPHRGKKDTSALLDLKSAIRKKASSDDAAGSAAVAPTTKASSASGSAAKASAAPSSTASAAASAGSASASSFGGGLNGGLNGLVAYGSSSDDDSDGDGD